MKNVAKYNLCKGVSTTLTFGTPIVTLACCGDFFVQRSESAISAAAMFVILILILFFKDKIAENFKMPSASIVCLICLVLIIVIENIIYPIKNVCIYTLIATGIDEMTFKHMYKIVESKFPSSASEFKKFGFMFTTSNALEEENK